MTNKVLDVRLNGDLVGHLEQGATGHLSFTYEGNASRALSVSLPLQEESHSHDRCEAYFGGLLPESEFARKAIAKRYGANANSTFSLLRAIGYDCAGAVSLHLPTEPTPAQASFTPEGQLLSESELAAHIRELPRKPLFSGVDGLRLSLAGAQDKAAVCLLNDQLALPAGGTPTTHILKPAITSVGDTVINEFICMRLARSVGLTVPHVEMRTAEEIPYLLVERYDRAFTPEERIYRIHQEDFCQALGVRATMKYQADGGPSLETCFALTMQLTVPAVARMELLRLLAFNVLIGNCDAHAKNYSLIHHADGRLALAPAYDLLCTRYYAGTNQKMAMKIAGYYESDRLYGRHWQRFCKGVGVSYPMLRTMLRDMGDALQEAIERELETMHDAEAIRLMRFISGHAADIVDRVHVSTGQNISSGA